MTTCVRSSIYYEQNYQYDIHFTAVELFMTYKMSVENVRSNILDLWATSMLNSHREVAPKT